MLKKEDAPLFAAILAVAVALFIAWAIPSPNQQEKYSNDKCTTHECREDAATEALAKYTEWLVIITVVLAGASLWQGYFLLRSDKTSRITAESAQTSANAALGTERARIFIKIEGENLVSRIREIVENRADSRSIHVGNPLAVHYRLVNHGKTPAIIHSVFAMIRVKPWPDSEPQFLGLYWPVEQRNGAVIPGNTEADRPEYCRHVEIFDLYDAEKVVSIGEDPPENAVWFFGEIVYSDVFENKWHHRFLWCYDGYTGVFQPDDYKHYNKSI
jgi:hypothetical protein